MGSASPIFGVKIPKIFELAPPRSTTKRGIYVFESGQFIDFCGLGRYIFFGENHPILKQQYLSGGGTKRQFGRLKISSSSRSMMHLHPVCSSISGGSNH